MAEQSAAMPSPFPPIAEYGFLSNCHTGALVAPDGAVDWLCVPRFDAPSVFGSLLDRGAGTFRLGPFGINVPAARHYEAGTNVLVTSGRRPPAGLWCATPSRWGPRPHLGSLVSRRIPVRPPTTAAALADRLRPGECASKVWSSPDQGIWEARGEPQHYVSSKLMCWVALDRAAELANMRGDADLRSKWAAAAEEIRADILERGVNERGRAPPALCDGQP